MTKHIDVVAYLHIVLGILSLLGGVIAFVAIAGGGLLSGDTTAIAITTGVGTVIAGLIIILALPSIIGGYGLLRRRSWARSVVVVLSIIELFGFPFGTLVGVYSLWVLFQEEVRVELSYA